MINGLPFLEHFFLYGLLRKHGQLTLFSFLVAKNIWKKRFFDEKRKTSALDEQVNRLRHEVDVQHKALMAHLESKGITILLCKIAPVTINNCIKVIP